MTPQTYAPFIAGIVAATAFFLLSGVGLRTQLLWLAIASFAASVLSLWLTWLLWSSERRRNGKAGLLRTAWEWVKFQIRWHRDYRHWLKEDCQFRCEHVVKRQMLENVMKGLPR